MADFVIEILVNDIQHIRPPIPILLLIDVTYKDDASRTRKGFAPENLVVDRRIALNWISALVKYPLYIVVAIM